MRAWVAQLSAWTQEDVPRRRARHFSGREGDMLQTGDSSPQQEADARHGTVGLVPPKYYRVGEITAHFGLSRQTIHNYTTMGLIAESRWTPGGHRLYDASVFGRVAAILHMKDRGLTMQEIQDHMSARAG